MPEIEDLERNRRLGTLSVDEFRPRVESRFAECIWAFAAGVDQLVDAVRVVMEIFAQDFSSERFVEVEVDQVFEIVGNFVCVGFRETGG